MGVSSLSEEEPRTIGPWLREKAVRNGDKRALEVMDRTKSYADVDLDTDRVAMGLIELGLEPGDHVATMMKNSLECIDCWFAMARLGVVEVPINPANRGFLLRYLLAQSRSRAVVVDQEYAERVAEVADDLPELLHVVINRDGEKDLGVVEFPRQVTVHELSSLYRDGTPPEVGVRTKDVAVILYTSGTTGPSKGVLLSHAANLMLSRHTCWLVGYRPEDVLYTAFPLHHINARYTSVMCALEADASLVMTQRFSASRFWDMCKEKGITAFNYQGGLLMMLFKQPERVDDADNPVRRAFGAPCPVEIWEPFEARFGLKLVEVYGSTEVAIATQNPVSDRRIGTAGRESSLYEVRIVDENDIPVPSETPGEIVVRPKRPSVMMSGYFDMPEATVAAWRNLWFHTGDRGRMDSDGFLTFIDSMKDCVRRRGENISSFEVEAVVNLHEAVLESAVYGVPSELGEEEVMVAVVLEPEARLTPVELLDYCQSNMAHFAIPRFVRWVDELPKTPSERVEKYKLRQDGLTDDSWDREAHGYVVAR